MRRFFTYIFALLITGTLYAANIQADFVVHWNGVNRGLVTAADLNAGSVIYGDTWGWNNSDSQVTGQRLSLVARTNTLTFPVSITVSNVVQNGDGTNWLYASWENLVGEEFLRIEFPGGYNSPTYTNVALAGFVLFDWTGATLNSTDGQWVRNTGGGASSVFNLWGDAGVMYFRNHATQPASTYGNVYVTEMLKVYYYVKVHIDPDGTNAFVRLYDPSNNYALVGESSSEIGRPTDVWDVAFNAGYLEAGLGAKPRGIYWGPMVGIYNPTDADIASLSSFVSYETVSNTVYNAAPYSTINLPTSTAGWSNTLSITKPLYLNWNQATLTNLFATAGNETPLISISSPGVVVSNLTIIGNGSLLGAGFAVYAMGTRIAHCTLTGLRAGVWSYISSNVIDHCVLVDNMQHGRHLGTVSGSGQTLWELLYPLPWDSLSYTVWEDLRVTNRLTGGLGVNGWETSGRGASYIVRHSIISYEGVQGYQTVDIHGDTNPADNWGGLGMQFYSNTNLFSGGAYSGRFADLRGGSSLVYSNSFSGMASPPYASAREEFGFSIGIVTNTYVWANSGTVGPYIAEGSEGYLALGVNVFDYAPTNLVAPPYPHPLTVPPRIYQKIIGGRGIYWGNGFIP